MRYQRFERHSIKNPPVWAYAAWLAFSVTGCIETVIVPDVGPPCLDSQAMCTDSSGAEFCATIASDNANCGTCGNVCPTGHVCAQGQCTVVCGPEMVKCDEQCIDPLTDNANCGTCGNVCPTGHVCAQGQCTVVCGSEMLKCDEQCIDPLTDNAFCGASGDCIGAHRGIACNTDHVCMAGTCVANCPEGTRDIDGICVPLPTTCAQIRQLDPAATDGEYTLFHEANLARAWPVYCHDMAGAPSEFLTLAAFGSNKNFSLVAHFDYPDSDVRTQFMRVRIDPVKLILNVDDFTFSYSSGIITGWGMMTQVSYGHAIACGWGDGAANVDLTGTPFLLDETFCGAGWGTIVPSPDGKSVDIMNVNGWCGGVSPCTVDEQGWRIHLKLPE